MINYGENEAYQKPSKGAHVLVVLYPMQGHLNPLLQFSKRLASKGLKTTVITTTSISSQFSSQTTTNSFDLEFIRIFDGSNQGYLGGDLQPYVDQLRIFMSQSFHELLNHYKQNATILKPTPKVVIYDAFMPWLFDVAKRFGLKGAPFFTQCCLVNSIYYHVYEGLIKSPINGKSLVSLPSLKGLLRVDDLPSFVNSPSVHPTVVRVVLDQFSNFKEANYLFFNTVDMLEIEVVNWMASQWPVKTIGPTIPSKYLDKRLPDDNDYGLNLFKPEIDACIIWLDAKESGSVVYVGF